MTKLLAAIKRNDNTSSEKDMLLGVLRKYVAEEEFINFITEQEKDAGEKHLHQTEANGFWGTTSYRFRSWPRVECRRSCLKHIRNALVHSSDKYGREDCFLPLSESEDVVVRYIPIVKFMAEQVIFAT